MPLAWHAHQAVLGAQRIWECASTRQTSRKAPPCTYKICVYSANAGTPSHAVRRVVHADLPAIHQVSQDGSIGWSLGQLQAELDLEFSTALVSISEAQVNGFICGWHVSGELQIMALAVLEDRRCQGIGRALLDELLRIGKGLGDTSACLELREGNESAMRLYDRAEFKEVGRRRLYYNNGDAAILMSKPL